VEKINSNHGPKLVLAHMPLLMVCLEGLGKLAQKFPNIASTSIYYLRDFLIAPSPILLKLYRQHSEYFMKEHQFKVLGKKMCFIIYIINLIDCRITVIDYIINMICTHMFGQSKGRK